ncbi:MULTISPECIES: hypothetical protein [Pedobacter]|uniref:Uncharacterized protein n=1 Tax=Pedobacter panaciterrae TaxID=363849 RepID=A0ABU8NMH0_9SPHI|nr:hypothetical protein [Pedobacter sp. V48]ETZ24863.1 hypothetical protein N824_01140 [Pedobacter sp. V48]
MNYPVFIFHELMFRLSEISPKIGTYVSSFVQDNTFVIHSTNGKLIVDEETMTMQYHDPALLSREYLDNLIDRFLFNESGK